MEGIVYALRQRAANAAHGHQVVDAGTDDALQPAELAQQFASFLRAKARYFFQPRRAARFRAPLAMPGNRKAMRLVANLLNQE